MILSARSFWPPGADRVRAISRLDGPRDLLLILRILVYAAAVPALTRTRLSSWERFAGGRRMRQPVVKRGAEQKTVDYVDAVLIAFRPVVRPGCLVRGLTLYHFLRKAGVDVTLSFGVGKVGGTFAGHCWLVRDGRPFLEPDRPDLLYIETFRLPMVVEAGA
jgi:Transglutaminase-like superfamily